MAAAITILLLVALAIAVVGSKATPTTRTSARSSNSLVLAAPKSAARTTTTTPGPAPTPEDTTPGVQAQCGYLAYPDRVITPDPRCTPGVVDPAAAADPERTVCAPGYARRLRPSERYTEPLKIEDMIRYASVGPPSAYEEDHLVAIEDGGSPRDPRNLWPEYRYQPGGALDKDQAEAKVHELICSGRVTVAQGARILEGDWKRVLGA